MLDSTTLLVLAGAGQLVLALASLAIPHVLGWREETRRLEPLTRSVFWTYAVYIWTTNVALGLGLVSALAPAALLDGSILARSVCAYAGLYWGGRLAIQFVFSRYAPPGALFKMAELALTALFVFLTAVYVAVFVGWLGT